MPRLIAALVILLAGASSAPAQRTADFSGAEQFWRIADELRRGTEPRAEEWDRLFATPGYAALDARERRRASIVLGMRAAFHPGLRGIRDSLLSANGWTARVIRHLETLPPLRAELAAFAEQLRREDILAAAAQRAQTLLPAGTVQRYGHPAIAFVFFLPDGRGYPGLIVADLANVMSKPDAVPFFAHELTHFYWSRLARAQDSAQARSPDPTGLLVLFGKIAEEAFGDQFDKSAVIDASDESLASDGYAADWREYIAEYRREFARAGDELAKLDAALASAASDSIRLRAIADSANRALPLEGRPVGMYMARVIRRELGDAALAATAGSPVDFVLTYQRAAARSSCGCRPLSASTMASVEKLRRSGGS